MTLPIARQADGGHALSGRGPEQGEPGTVDEAASPVGTYRLQTADGQLQLTLSDPSGERKIAVLGGSAAEPVADGAAYWRAELRPVPGGAVVADGSGRWWWLVGDVAVAIEGGHLDLSAIG